MRRRPNLTNSARLASKPGRSEIEAGANWRWRMKNFEIEGVLESPRACYSKLVIGAEECFACSKVAAELVDLKWFDRPLEHMEEMDNEGMPQVSDLEVENVDRPEMEAGSGHCFLKSQTPS